jgi:tetratricopeptide (TPR) repeat protein
MQPENSLAHYNLGVALMGMERPDDAVIEYNRAIKIDPNYANAYYALGMIYQAKGDQQDAVASYEKYVKLDPDGPYIQAAKESLDKLKQALGPGVAPQMEKVSEGDSARN